MSKKVHVVSIIVHFVCSTLSFFNKKVGISKLRLRFLKSPVCSKIKRKSLNTASGCAGFSTFLKKLSVWYILTTKRAIEIMC